VRSKFSCVRSSHHLCARALVHSLEGTLVKTKIRIDSSGLDAKNQIDASGTSHRQLHINTHSVVTGCSSGLLYVVDSYN